MHKFREKLKESTFFINKIYLFIIFLGLILTDATLGFYYFLLSMIIYAWKVITSKVPMSTPDNITVKTYIYKTNDKRDLKLDIYYPNESKDQKLPFIYFCHGGGWISGFRNQPSNVSWCKYLSSKGFTVSSIDYRYGYRNDMDDILSDYSDGLSYIKNNALKLKVDKNNIVLMGLSAGGHLALLYSAYNTFIHNKSKMEGIKSVVAYYPPSNLEDLFSDDNKSIFAKFAIRRTLNGRPTEAKEIYDYYSPINYISSEMIPTLIAHGKLDNTVPFQSSINLIKRLDYYNVDHTFLVHKTGDHSFDTTLNDYSTINILEKTVRYIKSSTKKGKQYDNNPYREPKKKSK